MSSDNNPQGYIEESLKDTILKELGLILDENTIAFFSVTLTRKPDGQILPTLTVMGMDKQNYEARIYLSDAVIRLAQAMRQRE